MSTTYDIDYTDHDFVNYTIEDGRLVTWQCECGEAGTVNEPTELRMKGYIAHLDTIDVGETE